jgi:hypothetical protein
MIFIIFLFLLSVYIQFGGFELIQIFILLIIFITSNVLIEFNPFSFKIIRLISILLILYIMHTNFDQSSYSLSLLIPFCQKEINFVQDFQVKNINYYKTQASVLFLTRLTSDLTDFLNNLDESQNYWVNFSFYPDILGYKMEDGMKLHISEPILINIDSSPLLLTQFINDRLNLMIDFYYLDDSIINSNQAVITVKFTEIELN